jgi:hypothetical protein
MLSILSQLGDQIKATLRFYLTPVRMATTEETRNAGEDVYGEPFTLFVGI